MEASLPLSSLEREKDLTTTVQVTEPLRIFRILEVLPHVFVELLEPVEAFLISGKLVSFEHADRRLKMYPPKLLIPLKLLLRLSLPVEEVENATILFVPTVFNYVERDFNTLFNQFFIFSAES